MKKAKNLSILLSSLLLLITTSSLSASFKFLHCHQPSGKKPYNVQCLYSVIGQKIDNPKAFSKLYVNTHMPYALCASVLCDVNPDKPSVATCVCPIIGASKQTPGWKKVSVGPLYYEVTHPRYKKNKITYITSTFSMAHFKNPSQHKNIVCHSDEPMTWANCFGKRCKVNYEIKDNKEVPIATCQCPLVKTTSFVTTGVSNESECKTAPNKAWSAATAQQAKNEMGIMLESYKRFFSKAIDPSSNSNTP